MARCGTVTFVARLDALPFSLHRDPLRLRASGKFADVRPGRMSGTLPKRRTFGTVTELPSYGCHPFSGFCVQSARFLLARSRRHNLNKFESHKGAVLMGERTVLSKPIRVPAMSRNAGQMSKSCSVSCTVLRCQGPEEFCWTIKAVNSHFCCSSGNVLTF